MAQKREHKSHQKAIDIWQNSRLPPVIEKIPLLNILSEFATYKRYPYLDGTDDPDDAFNAPDVLWDHLETQLLSAEELALLLDIERADEAKQLAVYRLIVILETYLRALTRLFTLAELGPQARQMSPAVSHFARLRDDQIGQQTYTL